VKALITGGGGQLAAELVPLFPSRDVFAPTHAELDIIDTERLRSAIEEWRPDVVINTAAFHNVDRCESEPEAAFAVNAAAVQRLASHCNSRGATLVHMSTDYVFSGRQSQPYREDDPVEPISVYGASKAAGEMAVRATTDNHLIVRTTGLYGRAGRRTRHGNFVETMLRLAEKGSAVSVVCDQVLTPSSCSDVAEVVAQLLAAGATGTYHATNSGECSWYEFAREIFRLADLRVDLKPVKQADRPAPARRPDYSVLDNARLAPVGILRPRPWQEALASYLVDATRRTVVTS
jgi:dTDP-4-dehydrorhamnose reductase